MTTTHSALAISYKSFDSITPTDMQIISVDHDCVKTTKCVLLFMLPCSFLG